MAVITFSVAQITLEVAVITSLMVKTTFVVVKIILNMTVITSSVAKFTL